jgi:hypothetical protein
MVEDVNGAEMEERGPERFEGEGDVLTETRK